MQQTTIGSEGGDAEELKTKRGMKRKKCDASQAKRGYQWVFNNQRANTTLIFFQEHPEGLRTLEPDRQTLHPPLKIEVCARFKHQK